MTSRFAYATHTEIERYRNSDLGLRVCGQKPFGSRHWEYPWAVEQSGVMHRTGLRLLDVAPDLTFPYPHILEAMGHRVTFIDLEKRRWSEKTVWGFDPRTMKDNFHVMDVRSMSFPDDSFDCIFCISVLEHIVCPTQNPEHPRLFEIFDSQGARPALAEMRRCLKPGGKLLLTVDHYGGSRWKPCFEKWDIFSDLFSVGFDCRKWIPFDRERIFHDPDTFISQFHGPYITLGFCLTK